MNWNKSVATEAALSIAKDRNERFQEAMGLPEMVKSKLEDMGIPVHSVKLPIQQMPLHDWVEEYKTEADRKFGAYKNIFNEGYFEITIPVAQRDELRNLLKNSNVDSMASFGTRLIDSEYFSSYAVHAIQLLESFGVKKEDISAKLESAALVSRIEHNNGNAFVIEGNDMIPDRLASSAWNNVLKT